LQQSVRENIALASTPKAAHRRETFSLQVAKLREIEPTQAKKMSDARPAAKDLREATISRSI